MTKFNKLNFKERDLKIAIFWNVNIFTIYLCHNNIGIFINKALSSMSFLNIKFFIQFLIVVICLIHTSQSREDKSLLPFQVNREICQSLNIQANENFDVRDQPGRTADGRAVAPADLPNSLSIQVPDKISIPVQLNVKNFSQLQNPAYNLSLDQGDIGQIDIDLHSGKIYYNNQPLFNEQEQKIREICHQLNF